MHKLYVDQYGNRFYAASRKDLQRQIPGRVSIMYFDTKEGKTMRSGYVIGKHWLTEYLPNVRAV